MELLAAVLLAGPIGYFAPTSRSGLMAYLVLWAAILPVQTIAVRDEGSLEPSYWVINALILVLGVVLNRWGRRRREGRARHALVRSTDARQAG